MYIILLLASAFIALCSADIKTDHEVKSLPGLDWQPEFKHYAGLLNVSTTRSLSYWFVESQGDKDHDPLVLWLNGGPGCSSLFGFLQEHGPFLLAEGDDIELKLLKNPHSWNKFANVIYLEAPAGVGFSQNDLFSSTVYNDNNTAVDNVIFLIAFLEAYPEYKGRDFYITGESYGGCYVPTLANKLLEQKAHVELKLKGISIGNGVTKNSYFKFSEVALGFHGAKISLYSLGKLLREICPSGFDKFCEGSEVVSDPKIHLKFTQSYRNMMMSNSVKRDINIYDINRRCYSDVGCSGNGISQYLNQVEVQRALHFVAEKGQKVEWDACNYTINRRYIACEDMTDDVKNLLKKNVKILYFYGETDTVCPFIMGDLFVHQIGSNPETIQWFVDDLYAGTKTTFDGGLIYTTIADCGHMAAAWKPKQTARAVHHFINGIEDWDS
uniref:Carboxypeptidase n=1 Tax=Bursaphelenchus xylophilus TaxID=6326 RepID=A0A1I7SDW3_BURXY